MKLYKLVSLIVALALLFAAIPPAGVAAQTEEPQTIVAIASANANFKTLVAAVSAAGLVDTLNGTGPFTVFAPTDAAFAKLGKATIDGLLADPEKLASILLYHVVPSKQMAADVLASTSAMTAAGLPVVYTVRNNQAFINNARITATDIVASNGVIHVIDTVILPPGSDIVDTAAANPQFKTLVAAVQAAGLVDTLKSAGPFTIFAPTDAAFAKLGKQTIDALLADPETLKSILLYHAVSGNVYAGRITDKQSTATVNGANVQFSIRNGQVFINDARVTVTNILTTNGVIHVIDTVILPPAE